MPMMSMKVSSKKFLSELWQRHYSFVGTAAYRITVPESLWFWYVMEFGSGGRQDPSAPYKSQWAPGETYPIDPRNGTALHWKDASGEHFAFHVDHPGIRPRLVYRGVRDEILAKASFYIASALARDGMRLSSIRTALLDDVMPAAVELMAEAFDTATPELKGSVATAWSSGAQIKMTQ
jgi:hypothetical protein